MVSPRSVNCSVASAAGGAVSAAGNSPPAIVLHFSRDDEAEDLVDVVHHRLEVFAFLLQLDDLPVFLQHLCRNMAGNSENLREIQPKGSNIYNYINKNKITLFSKQGVNKTKERPNSQIILNLFKHYIIYFFNILIRSKDKEYLGGMVDLLKSLINNHLECSDYLIEEFCNKNIIIEYLINCPSYEIKKLIVGILYCAMIKSVNGYELNKIEKTTKNNTYQTKTNKNLTKTQAPRLEEDEE